jgi:hypothetical protein
VKTIIVWVLHLAFIGGIVAFAVDRRIHQAELLLLRAQVDAAQGYAAWKDHVRRHPELECQ